MIRRESAWLPAANPYRGASSGYRGRFRNPPGLSTFNLHFIQFPSAAIIPGLCPQRNCGGNGCR
ncbi:hypothetical protein HMPREF1233_0029 [Streptococcus pyogenes GA19700]|nr:hypothetical protein HMPREF1233_0029 [Streptococcus pyogenes GA19700]